MKIGTLSHTPAQILENIKTALPAVAQTIKGGWDNIQSFYIKTHSSVSLPIWACNLDDTDGGRWSGLTKDDDDVSGTTNESDGSMSSPSDGDEDEEPTTAAEARTQVFGKKRGTAEQDEPPQKKARTASTATPPEKSAQKHRSVTKMKTNTATPVGKLEVDSAGKKVAGLSSGLSSAKVIGDSSVVKNIKQHSPQSPLALDRSEKKTIPAVRVNGDSEIRKKRMGLVDQKKMKLLKRKPDRSAKFAVIGKKPGQR